MATRPIKTRFHGCKSGCRVQKDVDSLTNILTPIPQNGVCKGWGYGTAFSHQFVRYLLYTFHYGFGKEFCIDCFGGLGTTVPKHLTYRKHIHTSIEE